MRKALFIVILCPVYFMVQSCEEDTFVVDPVVVTEEVMFVSGERVRLSGRLVAFENQAVSDHGFTLSLDEAFSNPITISLGQRTIPGKFIGETSGLSSGEVYYWKPFSVIDGKILEGEPGQFTTLLPGIISFTPTFAFGGLSMNIYGQNFTSDTKVFFDDVEAIVLDIEKESMIHLTIPPIANSKFPKIKVVSQGNERIATQTFEYVTGKWEFVDFFFNTSAYLLNVSFVENDTYYFGLGVEDFAPNTKLWSLDIPSWTWTETTYDQGVLLAPFHGTPYFGSGKSETGDESEKFFVIENGNFVKKNPLPFQLYKSAAFDIGGNTYVAGGVDIDNIVNYEVFKYIAAEDRWEVSGDVPAAINSDFPKFVHGSKVFFITPDQVVHRYDPLTNVWEDISFYPSATVADGDGVSQVIGDKAYVGLFKKDRSIWEYDVITNSWKQKTGYAGDLFSETLTSFVYEGIIYVFKNPDATSSNGMSIWTFNPADF